MRADTTESKGSITSEKYRVLVVNTGRRFLGRDYVALSMSCAAYEEDKAGAAQDLMKIAEAINDGERFQWMLNHPGAEMDYNVAGSKELIPGAITSWWVKWFSESKTYIARGKTQRECIDNAILGKVEVW